MELLPVTVYQALLSLDGLRSGRTAARESKQVGPVPEGHIEAVRPFVSLQVWTMIQFQLLTCARSGEIVGLRPCDINTSGPVWTAQIVEHKNAFRGLPRTLYIGPQAQALIKPLMLRPPDAPLFSAAEGLREVRRRGTLARHRGPETPRRSARRVGNRYRTDSYRRAIARACRKAGIPVWHPHQLRHTGATRVRAEFGPEAAQVMCGHEHIRTTEIYALRNQALAVRVAERIG